MSSAVGNIRRVVRWYRRRFSRGAVILLYHRVLDLPSDPYLLSVSPANFGEHLAVLRKHAHPMSLRDLVRQLRNGKIPRRAVVITFDDGYFDNLVYAKPLLEHYDTPATFFVTTGLLSDAREFWWDTLEQVLLESERLPETLRLVISGTSHEWQLGSAAVYSAQDRRRYASWNYSWSKDPTPRHAVFRLIHQLLKNLDNNGRCKVLRDLTEWAGIEIGVRRDYRALSATELIQLATGGLVEVGAHTIDHPVLSALPVARQSDEIRQSKAGLETILGHTVTSFAYPHGLRADYTQETVELVRGSGFHCACAAWPETIRSGIDLHTLPRFVMRNQDGEAFAEQIAAYFSQE